MKIFEVLGLPVKSQRGNGRRLTPTLGSKQIYNILDLAIVTPSSKDPNFISVKWKPSARSVLKQKGIYIWMHPDFGIFYVGIATKDNLGQRWNAHLQKLLNRAKVYYPKQWQEFAQRFLSQGQSQLDVNMVGDDLTKVRIAFYPIEMPEGLTPEEYKRSLEDLEDRIVQRWNPRAQGKYSADRPTVTRNV